MDRISKIEELVGNDMNQLIFTFISDIKIVFRSRGLILNIDGKPLIISEKK